LKSPTTRHCSIVSIDAGAPKVFDGPSLWRVQAAEALGLDSDQLIAAMSPGPAFPGVLHSLEAAFESNTSMIIDLGAGTGGVSEWMRLATGAAVYALEREDGACQAARRAFPELHVVQGRAAAAPFPDGTADAVVMSGVTSLMRDLAPEIAEVGRLLTPTGPFAIADLFSVSDVSSYSAPNVFRSAEDLTRILQGGGFTVIDAGFGEPDPDASWAAAAQAVDEWIDSHCADRPGYAEWKDDRRHLRRHIESGALLGGCIIARRTVQR
jgi:SAM-dependent methyltransferase